MAYRYNVFLGDFDLVLGPGSGVSATDFATDSGTAVPTVAGLITISGGSGISTSATGSTITITASGGGDVTGPASSTDNAIARYDGVTGKIIQNSGVIIDDTDNITGPVDVTTTGYFNLADGAFNDPILRFTADPDTGIGRASANSMALIAGGNVRFYITSTGLQANTNINAGSTGRFYLNNNSPSNTAPNYSFVNDTNTGMYRLSADEVGFTTGGTLAGYFDSSQNFILTNPLDPAYGGRDIWNEETGTSATMAVNNGYIANNASLVTLTMPAAAAVGDIVRVTGKGAGGWRIAQNASQTIHFGASSTTTGTGGRLDSTATYDSVEMVCITANTDFVVLSSVGSPTVT